MYYDQYGWTKTIVQKNITYILHVQSVVVVLVEGLLDRWQTALELMVRDAVDEGEESFAELLTHTDAYL